MCILPAWCGDSLVWKVMRGCWWYWWGKTVILANVHQKNCIFIQTLSLFVSDVRCVFLKVFFCKSWISKLNKFVRHSNVMMPTSIPDSDTFTPSHLYLHPIISTILPLTTLYVEKDSHVPSLLLYFSFLNLSYFYPS